MKVCPDCKTKLETREFREMNDWKIAYEHYDWCRNCEVVVLYAGEVLGLSKGE